MSSPFRDNLFSGKAAPAAAAKEKGGTPDSARPDGLHHMTNVEALARQGKEQSSVNSPDRNAHLWLEEQIARAQSGVISMVVRLTPALARVLLARNGSNRNQSLATIEGYARDIVNGAWSLNGEPIIVSRDGLLNDGQHRCEAVIAAGIAIDVVLVIGTDRDSRFTIDQGKVKTVGDYLAMEGHENANTLGATANYVWQYGERGAISEQMLMRATKSEIRNVVEQSRELLTSIRSIPAKGSNVVGGRSLLAFCHWVFCRGAPVHEVDAFFSYLVTGENLSASDPILYARNRLINMRGRMKPNERAELIFRAWNASRRRERPSKLPLLGGPLPMVER